MKKKISGKLVCLMAVSALILTACAASETGDTGNGNGNRGTFMWCLHSDRELFTDDFWKKFGIE